MSELTLALGQVAPWYNLGFVVIVVWLFIKLFRTKNERTARRVFFAKPWELLFIALCIYIVEEVLTVLRSAGVINIPVHINGFFELAIIIMFIYTLLVQREHVQKHHL